MCKQSSDRENVATGAYGGLLIGHSGYPCRAWVIAPFESPTAPVECAYNQAYGTTQFVIERTIGHIKRSFHCLHTELRVLPEGCCTTPVACCVMHNIGQHYSCEDGNCNLLQRMLLPPSPTEADDGVAQ
ncbi:hypothetical protein HPB47_019273 [Ixodes persulcatus]|uniref:Uncharacterized protein n=1 Tax=Ixodes persulcatus TaxID=34615 RepID=A0AC60QIL5_IXOPE|nr:hypothetical protein HPB47_019273 [Ixodes persulcatus]